MIAYSYYYITANPNKNLYYVGIYHQAGDLSPVSSRGGIIAPNFQTLEKAVTYIEKCVRHKRKFDFQNTEIKKYVCFRMPCSN